LTVPVAIGLLTVIYALWPAVSPPGPPKAPFRRRLSFGLLMGVLLTVLSALLWRVLGL